MKFSRGGGGSGREVGGALLTVNLANPAVGAPATYTIVGGPSRILAAQCVLITDATVITRNMALNLFEPVSGKGYFLAQTKAAHTAGLTVVYSWGDAAEVDGLASGQAVIIPLPPIIFPVGTALEINPANFQAGDRIIDVLLLLERFSS